MSSSLSLRRRSSSARFFENSAWETSSLSSQAFSAAALKMMLGGLSGDSEADFYFSLLTHYRGEFHLANFLQKKR